MKCIGNVRFYTVIATLIKNNQSSLIQMGCHSKLSVKEVTVKRQRNKNARKKKQEKTFPKYFL